MSYDMDSIPVADESVQVWCWTRRAYVKAYPVTKRKTPAPDPDRAMDAIPDPDPEDAKAPYTKSQQFVGWIEDAIYDAGRPLSVTEIARHIAAAGHVEINGRNDWVRWRERVRARIRKAPEGTFKLSHTETLSPGVTVKFYTVVK